MAKKINKKSVLNENIEGVPTSDSVQTKDEFVQDFLQDTEVKEPAPQVNNDFEIKNEVNTADFEIQDDIPLSEPEDIATSNILSVEASASMIVGTFDFVQQQVLGAIYKVKVKAKFETEDEHAYIQGLFKEVENNTFRISDLQISEQGKIRMLQRVKQKVDALPFNAEEFKQLEDSLILILKEMPQYQLGKNTAIIMSLITVMGGRIVDVISE